MRPLELTSRRACLLNSPPILAALMHHCFTYVWIKSAAKMVSTTAWASGTFFNQPIGAVTEGLSTFIYSLYVNNISAHKTGQRWAQILNGHQLPCAMICDMILFYCQSLHLCGNPITSLCSRSFLEKKNPSWPSQLVEALQEVWVLYHGTRVADACQAPPPPAPHTHTL